MFVYTVLMKTRLHFMTFFFLGTDHLSDVSSEEGKTHLFEEGMAY